MGPSSVYDWTSILLSDFCDSIGSSIEVSSISVCNHILVVCYMKFPVIIFHRRCGGWSGGAKVLGNLPVPGRPTYLDYSRARAYCACSRCGWGWFGHFYSHLSLLFSFSLSLGEGPI